MLPGPHTLL